ncbi:MULTISPECIES: hypothetical protein [Protofrankia]|uniref:hypothetical protein n=1 Tax=Protofrankia TaxID=2994361 RepID=UPI00191071BE|nr:MULTISPECIES: hypothetical protein [Protofrankia]
MSPKTHNHVRDEEKEEAGRAKKYQDGPDAGDETGTPTERSEQSRADQANGSTDNGRARGEAGRESEPEGVGGEGKSEARKPHSATLRTPFATARIEIPRAPGTSMKVGPIRLPSPTQTAFYVGLGVLAVTEVVEWPVAAAIGAGAYIAQHSHAGAAPAPRKSGQTEET